MNKSDLIAEVARTSGLSRTKAAKVVEIVFDTVTTSLAGGQGTRLIGFGTFSVSPRAARVGRNPRTGEPLHISASKSAKFKAGKALKDALNQDTAPESDDSTGGFSPQTSSW